MNSFKNNLRPRRSGRNALKSTNTTDLKTGNETNKTDVHSKSKTLQSKSRNIKKRNCGNGKKKRKDSRKQRLLRNERERKRRAKIKRNSKKYAEYLEKDRLRKKKALEEGKIKHVKDMTPRELRDQRKKKREQVRRFRERKKASLSLVSPDSPEIPDSPESPDEPPQDDSSFKDIATTRTSVNSSEKSKQHKIGEKLRKKLHAKKTREIGELNKKIMQLKRKVWKLKKADLRRTGKITSPELTPSSSVKRLCRLHKNIPSPVKRKLFEGYVLKSELRASLKSVTSYKEKQIMGRLVSGRILKHYHQLQSVKGLFSLKQMRAGRKLEKSKKERLNYARKKSFSSQASHKSVHNFFLSNDASTECPGKKQGRKYYGMQRQRRYLKDNMRELHQQFMSKNSKFVSYRTFCRNKPSWVVKPKLTSRDTCLCKLCENVKHLFTACKSNDVVNFGRVQELTRSLCCDVPSTECGAS